MLPARVFSTVRILAAAALVALAIPAGMVTAGAGTGGQAVAADTTPVQVYGAWHCGDDYCTWGKVRSITEFDSKNHWLIDRGDGGPSVNVVVLSFVNPMKLLTLSSDVNPLGGVPVGMTRDIVNYFKDEGVRVMLSIGGITYTDAWDQALATNATGLGLAAAARSGSASGSRNRDRLRAELEPEPLRFAVVHRCLPLGPPLRRDSGVNPAARLTIDLAAGDRWLIALTQKATKDWLTTTNPVLDYANAMVPARQPRSVAEATSNWQEHIDGKPKYAPPIPSLAPAKFTGGLYVALGAKPLPECISFATSLQRSTLPYVQTAAPKGAGTTPGMLGYMFWAAEKPSTRGIGTVPPNTCEGGVGVGANLMSIPVPMPALRQS